MSTYGKRKKGLLSSFSVFQDGKSYQDLGSTHTRTGKARTLKQKSHSRTMLDDGSGDELATTALLHDVPSPQNEPVRIPSLGNLSALATEDIIRPVSIKASMTNKQVVDKPLPSLPQKDPFHEQRQHWQNRPALATKTTNMKVTHTGAKRINKLQSSTSTPTGITYYTDAPIPKEPLTDHATEETPIPNLQKVSAADLSIKISNLMQQAVVQESQTRQRAAIYAAESAKLTPLERGKGAFAKATRAIKKRLSKGSNERFENSKRPTFDRKSSSLDLESPPEYESFDKFDPGRLDRRIAEGENLGNPKIRSLTGDGNIARKPLPVYESMKSRSLRSGTTNGQFSENSALESHRIPSPDYSGPEINFSKYKDKSRSTAIDAPVPMQTDDAQGASNSLEADPQSAAQPSIKASGLARHSDSQIFSSSPICSSTPHIRLQTQNTTDKAQHQGGRLSHVPSVLDFSFEARSAEASSESKSPKPRASDGRSLSVKRKGSSENLRASSVSRGKKVKVVTDNSNGDSGLEAGITRLNTRDDHAPVSNKSKHSKPTTKTNKRNGTNIFTVNRSNVAEAKTNALPKPSIVPVATSKGSSRQRPSSYSSTFFLRGRNPQAGMQRIASFDQDRMDIDELQIDDAAFQVKGKKKK